MEQEKFTITKDELERQFEKMWIKGFDEGERQGHIKTLISVVIVQIVILFLYWVVL